jgi:hypothetical protein
MQMCRLEIHDGEIHDPKVGPRTGFQLQSSTAAEETLFKICPTD